MYSNATHFLHLPSNDPAIVTKHDQHKIIIINYHYSYTPTNRDQPLGHAVQLERNYGAYFRIQ